MAKKLEVVIEAVTKGLEENLHKAEGRFKRTSHAAGVAGLALAGGLAVGLEKSVHAAMEAQTSQAKLEAAFKSSGLSLERFEPRINKLEASSRKLGFTEEDVHGSLSSLIIATHNYGQAAKDMSVAEDIARFKHVSLETATKTLTMAMAGSQRATKQLGLSVQAVTTQQDAAKIAYGKAKDALDAQFPSVSKMTAAQKEHKQALEDDLAQQYAADKAQAQIQDHTATSAKVIELVSEKLHGQADAYSKTAAGGMAQFGAQLNYLEISIGTALIPVMTKAATVLANLTAFFTEHTRETKLLIAAIAGVAAVLITTSAAMKVYEAAMVVIRVGTAAWTAAQWLLNAALTANPIGIVVVALAALAAGLVLAYQHSATFREIVQGALHAVQVAVDFLGDHWRLMLAILFGPVGIAIGHIDAIIAAVKILVGWIQSAIDGVETLIGWIEKIHVPDIPFVGGGTAKPANKLPRHAAGAHNVAGGLALVGERGPEIVNLPRGSDVIPNSQIGGMMTVNLTLDGKTLAQVLIDPLRGEARIYKQQTGKAAFA